VFGTYLPEHIEYLSSPELALTIYPNGVRILGRENPAARAHALIAESATVTDALQCMSAEGQELEKRIKELWRFRHERDRLDRGAMLAASQLAETPLDFHDWEILYRELLQVIVASRGASRLIQAAVRESDGTGRDRRPASGRVRRAAREARTYGRRKFEKAAADRGVRLVETLASRVFRLLGRRRRR
jgi:hypothetical protein